MAQSTLVATIGLSVYHMLVMHQTTQAKITKPSPTNSSGVQYSKNYIYSRIDVILCYIDVLIMVLCSMQLYQKMIKPICSIDIFLPWTMWYGWQTADGCLLLRGAFVLSTTVEKISSTDSEIKTDSEAHAHLSAGTDKLLPLLFKKLKRTLAQPLCSIFAQLLCVGWIFAHWN